MQFFKDIGEIITGQYANILRGVGWTMLLALVGTIIGLLIGLLMGVVRTIPKSKHGFTRFLQKFANVLINIYVEVFRGTPMMVQAMVIYWGFAYANPGSELPLIPAGIFIVSINTGAYMTEIVRGGIISVDKGQFEGAHAIGMTHTQTMFHVIIPQVLRNILPSVANEFVINIKDTSVLNVIGVMELYFYIKMIGKINWNPFPAYTVACVIYLILTFTVTRILRLIEKKLMGSKNYTVCGSQSDPAAEIHIKEGD